MGGSTYLILRASRRHHGSNEPIWPGVIIVLLTFACLIALPIMLDTNPVIELNYDNHAQTLQVTAIANGARDQVIDSLIEGELNEWRGCNPGASLKKQSEKTGKTKRIINYSVTFR